MLVNFFLKQCNSISRNLFAFISLYNSCLKVNLRIKHLPYCSATVLCKSNQMMFCSDVMSFPCTSRYQFSSRYYSSSSKILYTIFGMFNEFTGREEIKGVSQSPDS